MSSFETTHPLLAHDDSGGDGRLVVMLPGAGDVRSEYRFLSAPLTAAGHRVVIADLPGHGDSPTAGGYSVAAAAAALIELLEALDGGSAVVVGCSFAPAAAVWAATERPDLIDGVVAISPHFDGDDSLQGRALNRAIRLLLRGPWAAGMWARLYTGWYKEHPPSDLDVEVRHIRRMLAEPARRLAVRETLTAHRDGVRERMDALAVPTLVVFGSLDDHFADPVGEAADVSRRLGGDCLVVDGAGHYPHVERPSVVGDALVAFLEAIA